MRLLSLTFSRVFPLLCCALLAACGGGSSSSSSTSGPSNLFPKGVTTGTVSFGGETAMTLHPQFYDADTTQAYYSGSLEFPAQSSDEDESSTTAKTVSFNGINMRKTSETQPGRLVFYFDQSQNQPLIGRLVLTLPVSGMNDEEGRRIGIVESSTDLEYHAVNGTITKLQLSGAPVTISWEL